MEQENKTNNDKAKQIQKKTLKIVLITIGIILIVSLITIGVIAITNKVKEEQNKRTVPNLVGMTYKEATEELTKLELDYKITPWKTPLDYDTITTQNPPADTTVQKGTKIEISLETPTTVVSDNFYGMRFPLKIGDFCNIYRQKLTERLKERDISLETTSDIYLTEKSFSKYASKHEQSSSDLYFATLKLTGDMEITFSILTEPNTNYIVGVMVLANEKDYNANTTLGNVYKLIIADIITPTIIRTLDSSIEDYSEITSILNTNACYFKNNICYCVSKISDSISFQYYSISESKYNELFSNETNNSTTTSQQITEEDIKERISFFNSYYDLGFEPTDEQMQEMIEFANSTEDFGNDALLDFILEKGWTVQGTGTIDNSSSSSNNSSSSKSNKSTSSNNNSNTSTKNTPQPYITVTVDPYSYLSQEEKNRIYENNETKSFKIVIKFNDKIIKSETTTYTESITYENLKVDSINGTLTVEINGEIVPDVNGNKNVNVSMYYIDEDLYNNQFTFYDISSYAG